MNDSSNSSMDKLKKEFFIKYHNANPSTIWEFIEENFVSKDELKGFILPSLSDYDPKTEITNLRVTKTFLESIGFDIN